VDVALTWQPSLFGSVGSGVDASFSGLDRAWLDEASWVDHCRGWVVGADTAFEEVVRAVPWGQRRRWMYEREVDEPRLTSSYRIEDAPATFPFLKEARIALVGRYGVDFDSVGINLYRDGADSVAWHRDRIPTEIVDPVVALVSLGEPRKFLLRPKAGGSSRSFKLGHGDLLVTGGQTQRRFEHSVPKVASSGPRISLAFRHGIRYD
jgi:alkylated DNA repair dioxygenase AlkB